MEISTNSEPEPYNPYMDARWRCAKGGGSTTTNTQDPVYNARMAAVAEAELAMTTDYYTYYKQYYEPYEKAQIQANTSLIGKQTELAAGETKSALSLLPMATAAKQAQNEAAFEGIQAKRPVTAEFYKQVLEGTDVNEAMGMATADVEQAYKGMAGQRSRELGRMGINPASGKYAGQQGKDLRDRAKALAGARTAARRTATNDSWTKLQVAMGV